MPASNEPNGQLTSRRYRGRRVFAGPSRDTIYARDGWRDTIDCGTGWGVDTVYADRFDVVARNCERVRRL